MCKNLLLIIFITGCTTTSEAILTGPNSYVISSESSISINDGLEKVYEKAKEVCSQQEKIFLQSDISSRGSGGDVPMTGLILEFRCLDSDHPSLNTSN